MSNIRQIERAQFPTAIYQNLVNVEVLQAANIGPAVGWDMGCAISIYECNV